MPEDLASALKAASEEIRKSAIKDIAKHIAAGTKGAEEFKREIEQGNVKTEDLVNKARELSRNMKEAEEHAKSFNERLKDATGIALPTSWAEALKMAGKVTFEWWEHLSVVNRQLYDISANLGNMGDKSREFDILITEVGAKFLEMPDNVRALVQSMTSVGVTAETIKEHLDDIYVLSKQWSEVTPEKQVQMMSDYIKQFKMNGDEAWATMFSLYQTSQSLKDVYKDLDIKEFVNQTHQVALSMRQYGLEAQDAIALTSTLVRLGVEQARIPELAQRLGGIGLQAPETMGFMAQQFLLPQMQRELERPDLAPARREELERRMAIAQEGIIGAGGVMATATGPERTAAQTGMLEFMLAQVGTSLTDPIENIVGALTMIDLPGVGKMGIEQAKQFAMATNQLTTEGMKLSKDDIDKMTKLDDKVLESFGIQREDLKEGNKISLGLQEAFGLNYELARVSTKDAKDAADKQRDLARDAAIATTESKDYLKLIQGHTGNIMQVLLYGKSPGEQAAIAAKAFIEERPEATGADLRRMLGEKGLQGFIGTSGVQETFQQIKEREAFRKENISMAEASLQAEFDKKRAVAAKSAISKWEAGEAPEGITKEEYIRQETLKVLQEFARSTRGSQTEYEKAAKVDVVMHMDENMKVTFETLKKIQTTG